MSEPNASEPTPWPSGPAIRIKLQLYCGDAIAMGPGRADLLAAIAATGSISAAGRALGMSYRRSWMLVDTMNRCWSAPLVEAVAGGSQGGGTRLTDLGAAVLADYRALVAGLERDADCPLRERLLAALRDAPDEGDTSR